MVSSVRLPLGFALLLAAALSAQEGNSKLFRRYGFTYNEAYPQASPEQTLKSMVKAIDSQRFDYMVAHMIDPVYIDGRVKMFTVTLKAGGEEIKALAGFDKVLKEIQGHFREDPVLEREIRKFAKEAKWEEIGDRSVGTWAGSPRKIVMRKIEERWYMEDRQR